MKWSVAGEDKAARGILGLAFHTVVGTVGSSLVAILLQVAIGQGHRVSDAESLVTYIISGALLGLLFTPRLLSRSAPFVGLFGLVVLWIGAHELWHGWNPTWSHQTQKDYVLSQLFCLGSGCSDSEGLYALFFGWPFLCLTSYSLGGLVALLAVRLKTARPRTNART